MECKRNTKLKVSIFYHKIFFLQGKQILLNWKFLWVWLNDFSVFPKILTLEVINDWWSSFSLHFLNCWVLFNLIHDCWWIIDFCVVFGDISSSRIFPHLPHCLSWKSHKFQSPAELFFYKNLKNWLIFPISNFCLSTYPGHKIMLDMSLMTFMT